MIANAISAGHDILEAANTPIDKNEPRYCYCNGVSYGEMIKCDNPWVKIILFC
jgi:Chromatin remodeling protein, contains PhD zinc finger